MPFEHFQIRVANHNRQFLRVRLLGISQISIQTTSILFFSGHLAIEVSFGLDFTFNGYIFND